MYEPGSSPQLDYRYEPDSSPQPDYRLERLDDAAGAYLDVEFQPHRPAGANQPDVRPFIRAAERPAAGEVRVECGAPPVARA